MDWNIEGLNDPFLLINLEPTEKIFCKTNTIVSVDSSLLIEAKTREGLLGSFFKSFVNKNSFFYQNISALFDKGTIRLAPKLPGDICIIDIENGSYFLNDDCFLAGTEQIHLELSKQKITTALFGKKGGFFINKTNGVGKIAICSFGSIIPVKITENNPVSFNRELVLAWSSNLSSELIVQKNNNSSIHNFWNNMKSREFILHKFSGNGTIYLSSRSKSEYINWIRSVQLPKN